MRQQLILLGFTAASVDAWPCGAATLEAWLLRFVPTDPHTPKLDGHELCQAIRAAEGGQRRVPFVALTAEPSMAKRGAA